jgi:hypothetical protein
MTTLFAVAEMTVAPVATTAGVRTSARGPAPAWPTVLVPQAYNFPAVEMAQAVADPLARLR